MTDKLIRGTPELAERVLEHVTGQGSPLLEVGEAWKAGASVEQNDLELAIEELEDELEGDLSDEERETVTDLRAELAKLHPAGQDLGDGEILRRRRKALGWRQQELAEKAGVRVATISDLETGKATNPRRSTLRLIEAALADAERGEFPPWMPERQKPLTLARTAFEAARCRSKEIFSRGDSSDRARAEFAEALLEEQRLWELLRAEIAQVEGQGDAGGPWPE